MPTLATVVVCTYNRAASLRYALASLCTLQTNGKFEYEILVVDDGSTDCTREIVRSFMKDITVEVRYARQDNCGVAAARNHGVRCARGEWVAFFDDDQLAAPEWLSSLMQTADAANADCIGGPCLLSLPPNNPLIMTPTIRSLLGHNPLMLEDSLRGRSRIDPRRRPLPGSGNAMVRKALFDRIGMFSRGRHCGEDLEFFARAQRSGAKFAVASDAIVYHVIPLERLTPEYLLALATRNGKSSGEIDARVEGMSRSVWFAALRFLRLCLWTFPILIFHFTARNQSRLLSSRCTGRYAIQHIAAVCKAVSQQLLRRPSR